MTLHPRHNDSRRRAVAIVQFAMGAVLLFGCVSLAVDVGYMCWARGQIQRSVDSAALAGASGLMTDDVDARVHEFGGANGVVTGGLNPNELVIVIGNWNGIERTFTAGLLGEVRPNAVQVDGFRGSLGLIFSKVMGFHQTQVARQAIAIAGAGKCAGIWGIEGVDVGGDFITDSYDSDYANYGDPGNIRPNGDVCSCADIVVHGGIGIHGDAMYGDNGEFIENGSSNEVYGLIGEHQCDTPEVNIDFEAAEEDNNNENIPLTSDGTSPWQGNANNAHLKLTDDEHLDLPPGTYYFSDVDMTGQAYLGISGPTTIYVNGNAAFTGGGIVNYTQDPSQLTIYVAGPDLKMSGGSAYYGAIIAPTATLSTQGDFEAFGVVLAQFLNFGGNAKFHVDEGLVLDLFDEHAIAPVLVK